MAQIFSVFSRPFHNLPAKAKAAFPEVKAEPLLKFSFNVRAVDGSAFLMEVLAPNAEVASRFVKRYPGIVTSDLVRPEGHA